MHTLIYRHAADGVSETFLGQQARLLPGRVTVVAGLESPAVDGRPLLKRGSVGRAVRAAVRLPVTELSKRGLETADVYAAVDGALRAVRPDVVLAQYGWLGATIAPRVRRVGVPLVVHFHGSDASVRAVLDRHADGYRAMFEYASAVVAVSEPMRDRLVGLGAPADRVHLIPYGVDLETFPACDPAAAGPVAAAVGRFTEKKAPHLLVAAFAAVLRRLPEARLRVVGDGDLKGVAEDLADALGVRHAVEFLGVQPPDRVRAELAAARLFVQHSVTASNGDTEGSPVAVTEAAVSGLPVVSTRHANIPRIVRHGETGLLCEERDVPAFVEHLVRLLSDPAAAGRMGAAAREHAARHFDAGEQAARLGRVLQAAAGRRAGDS